LSSQFKEYNLECVGCHVTGYERPGGSSVTHVAQLENVQCEECHGPGSKHALNPTDVTSIVVKPPPSRCLECHHPPHVEQFDAVAQLKEVLGPGHGMPAR
jgi:mono/diheme cytochrome c family protein